MVEYHGYDINEYYFEYPVNAAGYLTMCVYISKNCINCPHCRYCIASELPEGRWILNER